MYALACYVLFTVGTCVVLSITILLVFALILKELIAICVRLGRVLRVDVASGVFGSENRQSTEVDCED